MNRFEHEQERIRAIKMFRLVKRALTLDQRSKIKPSLKNPSLLDVSAFTGGQSMAEARAMSSGSMMGRQPNYTEEELKAGDEREKARIAKLVATRGGSTPGRTQYGVSTNTKQGLKNAAIASCKSAGNDDAYCKENFMKFL